MTEKKSGNEVQVIEKVEAPVYNDPQVGRVIRDFGLYRVVVDNSTVEEMKGRVVYAVINNDTGVIEEECSVLPQALLHAGQFNKEMLNDRWKDRLAPTNMMVPTGAQIVPPGRVQ